uniref:Uncharacterized protein n=1 Tax=Ditylenchus dipsaci TaxID=166011 RepID=A0A915CNA3_9BILA
MSWLATEKTGQQLASNGTSEAQDFPCLFCQVNTYSANCDRNLQQRSDILHQARSPANRPILLISLIWRLRREDLLDPSLEDEESNRGTSDFEDDLDQESEQVESADFAFLSTTPVGDYGNQTYCSQRSVLSNKSKGGNPTRKWVHLLDSEVGLMVGAQWLAKSLLKGCGHISKVVENFFTLEGIGNKEERELTQQEVWDTFKSSVSRSGTALSQNCHGSNSTPFALQFTASLRTLS